MISDTIGKCRTDGDVWETPQKHKCEEIEQNSDASPDWIDKQGRFAGEFCKKWCWTNNWTHDKRNSEVLNGTSNYIDQLTIDECVRRCDVKGNGCKIAVVKSNDGDGGTPGLRSCYHREGTGDVVFYDNYEWMSFVRP